MPASPSTAESTVLAALRTEHIYHHFQPIWTTATGGLLGFEALARFPHAVQPETTWALAHAIGADVAMDRISVGCALEQARALPGILFLNVSAAAASRDAACTLLATIQTGGARSRRAIERIVVEVTEDAAGDLNRLKMAIEQMGRAGIMVALDDIGTGEANAQRFCAIRPAMAKLPRDIMRECHAGRPETLRRWVALAQTTDTRLVAEGVEDAACRARLVREGVHYAQGYAFGPPAAAPSWTADALAAVRPTMAPMARKVSGTLPAT